jgi:hypothetical protein
MPSEPTPAVRTPYVSQYAWLDRMEQADTRPTGDQQPKAPQGQAPASTQRSFQTLHRRTVVVSSIQRMPCKR